MKVTAINAYGTGRYIIHFEDDLPCKCGVVNFTRIWHFTKKPTEKQAVAKLQDELAKLKP